MIHYHGGPITPDTVAIRVYRSRHPFISVAAPQQIRLAAAVCQSFALDNGAYSAWEAKRSPNWPYYYQWCKEWLAHPACDWAVIPDDIEGDEAANDVLIREWPFGLRGVPVWHLHESIERLRRLCAEWPRVALGSSGEYAEVGTAAWWQRMAKAMNAICIDGRPVSKLHGLRMLNPDVFIRLPLASADSTNVARNSGMDTAWRGTYAPSNEETRAQVLVERIEQYNAAERWEPQAEQQSLFEIA